MKRALRNGGYGGYGGIGYWFLGNHELILLGKKPGVPNIGTGESSLFFAPKSQHSSKPDNVHVIAEKYLPGPSVELFGRRGRSRWMVIGDQALDLWSRPETIEDAMARLGLRTKETSEHFKVALAKLRGFTAKQKGL
jgi:N6-adenosine-specific RNA methylase IME4